MFPRPATGTFGRCVGASLGHRPSYPTRTQAHTAHTQSHGSPTVIHTYIHQDSHTLRLELLPEPIHTRTLSEGNPNPIVSPKVASHAFHSSFLIPHSLLRQFASTRQTHTHLRYSGTPWHHVLANSPILAAHDVAFIQKPGQLRSLCVP